MRREWEAQRDALATVRRLQCAVFGQRLFVVVAQDRRCANFKASLVGHQCGTVVDLDLRVKPRDLDASIRVALCDVRCPRSSHWRGIRRFAEVS